jgi:hypothetical protein
MCRPNALMACVRAAALEGSSACIRHIQSLSVHLLLVASIARVHCKPTPAVTQVFRPSGTPGPPPTLCLVVALSKSSTCRCHQKQWLQLAPCRCWVVSRTKSCCQPLCSLTTIRMPVLLLAGAVAWRCCLGCLAVGSSSCFA